MQDLFKNGGRFISVGIVVIFCCILIGTLLYKQATDGFLIEWFPIFLILVGGHFIYWGLRLFFQKSYFLSWVHWWGDSNTTFNYSYNRYLRSFKSVVTGFILAGAGIGFLSPVLFGVMILLLPVAGIFFILGAFVLLFSNRINNSFWNKVWTLKAPEEERRLLVQHLFLWGGTILFLCYMFLYMAGTVPVILPEWHK